MEAFTDFVVGHGELWSAMLFAATLRKLGTDAVFMDTRETMVVNPTSDGNSVDVDYAASNAKLDQWSHRNGQHEVRPQACRVSRGACGGVLAATGSLTGFLTPTRLEVRGRWCTMAAQPQMLPAEVVQPMVL